MSKKILIIELETGNDLTNEEITTLLNAGCYSDYSFVEVIAELPKF
jgi:hypothetical protein